jgi:hypothetical protein
MVARTIAALPSSTSMVITNEHRNVPRLGDDHRRRP